MATFLAITRRAGPGQGGLPNHALLMYFSTLRRSFPALRPLQGWRGDQIKIMVNRL